MESLCLNLQACITSKASSKTFAMAVELMSDSPHVSQVLDEESGETSQLIPIPEEGGVEPGRDDDSEQVLQQEESEQVQSGMEPGQPAAAAVEVEETRTTGVNDLPTASTATGPGVEIGTTEGQGQTPAETETENEPAAEGEGEEKGVEPAAVLMDILEVPEIQIRVEVEEEEGEEEGKTGEMESSTSEMATEEVRESSNVGVCACPNPSLALSTILCDSDNN